MGIGGIADMDCGQVCRFVVLGKGDRIFASDSSCALLASQKLRGHYRERIVSPVLSPSIVGMLCLHIHCSPLLLCSAY